MTKRMAWTKRPPGGDRSGTVQSERTRQKISESMRRPRREACGGGARHGEQVRRRLFQDAEDKVYRDALEYLLAHQLEPAEALREIVGDRKHPDRMRAVGEWLDRTHGKPVQVQRTVALTGQLSREEIAQLLAPAAPLLGLEAPVTVATLQGESVRMRGSARSLPDSDPANDRSGTLRRAYGSP